MKTNFTNFISEIVPSNDKFLAIGLCETKMTNATQRVYNIDGYKQYANNISSKMGGVCLYISENYSSKRLNNLCVATIFFESVFVEVSIGKLNSVIVGMVYRRPGTTKDDFLKKLDEILSIINGRRCIVMGDINLNLLDFNCDDKVRDLVNLFSQFSFVPHVTKPTRVTPSSATCIDHVWSNLGSNCARIVNEIYSKIIITDVSDHFPCFISIDKFKIKHERKTITYRLKGPECDEKFKESIENADWEDLLRTNDVQLAFSLFNDIVVEFYNDAYPLVTKNINTKHILNPWMTSGIRNSIKTKQKLYKKYIKRPITYSNEYKNYRNLLNKTIKLAKSTYFCSKFEAVKGNSKSTWNIINQLLGNKRSSVSETFEINSKTTSNPVEIANAFNLYYTNLANTISQNLPEIPDSDFRQYLPQRNFDNITWELTTPIEIEKILSQLKSSSPGIDKLPMSLFKNNSRIFSHILSHLCNMSLSSGTFPEIHKKGIVSPLYKSKDPQDVTNYRPVCLLNSVSKILEKVVNIRLLNHLNNNNILNNNQFAYRKGRNTEGVAMKLCNDILRGFDENKLGIAVFLDLSRAFDCVNHKILLEKLKHYGISGIAHNWFANYLENRTQSVIIRGSESDWLPVTAGVPRGSILGPILFLIYVNDICNANENDNNLLFADDTTIYEIGHCYFELVTRINANLLQLKAWFVCNKLSLNVLKTEAMLFSRRVIYHPLPPIIFDEQPIPYSFKIKFLGFYLDPKLSWKEHIKVVRNKVSSVCGVLHSIRNQITLPVARLIYYTLAYPHFTYGNILWTSTNPGNLSPLTIIQKRLIRIIGKLNYNDHTNPKFIEYNLCKFSDICSLNLAVFVFKYLNDLVFSPVVFNVRRQNDYNIRNLNLLEISFVRSTQSQLFIVC